MCRDEWAYECFTELHDLPDMARHACSVWGRTTEAGPWLGIATSPRQLSTRTPSHIIIRHPYTLELFTVLSFITFNVLIHVRFILAHHSLIIGVILTAAHAST